MSKEKPVVGVASASSPTAANQTISFVSAIPSNVTYGSNTTYTPDATASSGLPVTITIDAVSANVCTLSSGIATSTTSSLSQNTSPNAIVATYSGGAYVGGNVSGFANSTSASFSQYVNATFTATLPDTPVNYLYEWDSSNCQYFYPRWN